MPDDDKRELGQPRTTEDNLVDLSPYSQFKKELEEVYSVILEIDIINTTQLYESIKKYQDEKIYLYLSALKEKVKEAENKLKQQKDIIYENQMEKFLLLESKINQQSYTLSEYTMQFNALISEMNRYIEEIDEIKKEMKVVVNDMRETHREIRENIRQNIQSDRWSVESILELVDIDSLSGDEEERTKNNVNLLVSILPEYEALLKVDPLPMDQDAPPTYDELFPDPIQLMEKAAAQKVESSETMRHYSPEEKTAVVSEVLSVFRRCLLANDGPSLTPQLDKLTRLKERGAELTQRHEVVNKKLVECRKNARKLYGECENSNIDVALGQLNLDLIKLGVNEFESTGKDTSLGQDSEQGVATGPSTAAPGEGIQNFGRDKIKDIPSMGSGVVSELSGSSTEVYMNYIEEQNRRILEMQEYQTTLNQKIEDVMDVLANKLIEAELIANKNGLHEFMDELDIPDALRNAWADTGGKLSEYKDNLQKDLDEIKSHTDSLEQLEESRNQLQSAVDEQMQSAAIDTNAITDLQAGIDTISNEIQRIRAELQKKEQDRKKLIDATKGENLLATMSGLIQKTVEIAEKQVKTLRSESDTAVAAQHASSEIESDELARVVRARSQGAQDPSYDTDTSDDETSDYGVLRRLRGEETTEDVLPSAPDVEVEEVSFDDVEGFAPIDAPLGDEVETPIPKKDALSTELATYQAVYPTKSDLARPLETVSANSVYQFSEKHILQVKAKVNEHFVMRSKDGKYLNDKMSLSKKEKGFYSKNTLATDLIKQTYNKLLHDYGRYLESSGLLGKDESVVMYPLNSGQKIECLSIVGADGKTHRSLTEKEKVGFQAYRHHNISRVSYHIFKASGAGLKATFCNAKPYQPGVKAEAQQTKAPAGVKEGVDMGEVEKLIKKNVVRLKTPLNYIFEDALLNPKLSEHNDRGAGVFKDNSKIMKLSIDAILKAEEKFIQKISQLAPEVKSDPHFNAKIREVVLEHVNGNLSKHDFKILSGDKFNALATKGGGNEKRHSSSNEA